MSRDVPQNLLEELKKVWKQEWKKLTLADDFIFSRVMQNIEICKEVLELLLKINITKIEYPTVQKVFQSLKNSKGIRLDVYVQETGGQRVFDIEIQTVITKEEALRARYYQGMLDLDNLLKGNDYTELPQTYIIFLCMKDPFGLNLPVYHKQSFIDPDNRHSYDDKTKKIFYNVGRYQDVEDPKIRRFLGYLKKKETSDKLTRRLDQMVEELKAIEMGFSDYIAIRQREFDWLRQGKEEGYIHGLKAGLEQGLEQGAHQKAVETAEKLLSMGLSLEQVAEGTNLPLETIQRLGNATKN
ncbi:MAG: Rpn family recombination-promoting nuclease/putative transposase [Spirochaetaceae bacterium]|nr:Rpn family recombination-promoting nuclease/putative transposase [Spirochaetaceae bacterium]